MSIFSAMRTSVSGMNAQAGRLSAYSENIANADTVGYKSASVQFRTLLLDRGYGDYTSGGVDFLVRYGIDRQGALAAAANSTDLGISGDGFFVVADASGATHLTRAGAFVPDADGYLVNAAGFRLMGMPANGSGATGLGGLTPIKLNLTDMVATPTRNGVFAANLPAGATVVAAADLPSANLATSKWTAKSSLTVYDDLGAARTLDIYYSKTADNKWEATVYDAAKAASGGGFPYSSGPLSVANLEFDPTNGKLLTPSPATLSAAVPGGETVSIDISRMTQLGADYTVLSASTDGNAPSSVKQIRIDPDGTVSTVCGAGATVAQFKINLAMVASADNLRPVSGNVFDLTQKSGGAALGAAGQGPFGLLVSGALESSTVDIASELTDMIETQRAYTANSKAFQVATDMADVLVNLKV